ncbi:MAG: 16S rRNA (guanine(966)-N(2))-methyltransferase RsmD [Lachnospiraceae bacterium]|jgi:16S rRNA (guanine966-N2)-methyltransferase|nr:16S rRNA (guanine(966)-N(2))-methyltransferase RsmD [Lachnospiraceae bacterium]
MRIISGTARGTKLKTLEGTTTRPTLDRVKEPLFSILQNSIQDAMILDLFSGSGALGLEALSRGAKYAVLCDNNFDAIKIIKENIAKTKFDVTTKVIGSDFKDSLLELSKSNMQFDIIFLDPPYKTEYAFEATRQILEYNLLLPTGLIVLETNDIKREETLLNKLNINIIDKRKYGKVNLIFVNRKG